MADLSAVSPQGSEATPEDYAVLHEQLGRVPRSVVGIAARCKCGRPLVVVTAPRLDDGTPFPTTFYMTSPELTRGCSTLEAEHLMEELNQRLQDDAELAESYGLAHADYLRRRELLGSVPEIAEFSAGGMPTRVKCLHAVVAHSLAVGPGINPLGDQTLDILAERGLWDAARCRC